MSVIYWNCWHFYGTDKYNSYVKQYDSTINEAILETYSIKREMYHARNFLFVCQLPEISKDQSHLSIYRCHIGDD